MISNLTIAPIDAVLCAGGPFEMGLAQGESLANRILATYEVLRNLEAFRLEQPWWLPFSWFRRLAARKAGRTVAPAIKAIAPDQHERVQGTARGSGLRDDSLCLIHALEGLLANVLSNIDIPPPGGCSALAVRGRMSATGEPLIAHNFDYWLTTACIQCLQRSRALRVSYVPACHANFVEFAL